MLRVFFFASAINTSHFYHLGMVWTQKMMILDGDQIRLFLAGESKEALPTALSERSFTRPRWGGGEVPWQRRRIEPWGVWSIRSMAAGCWGAFNWWTFLRKRCSIMSGRAWWKPEFQTPCLWYEGNCHQGNILGILHKVLGELVVLWPWFKNW